MVAEGIHTWGSEWRPLEEMLTGQTIVAVVPDVSLATGALLGLRVRLSDGWVVDITPGDRRWDGFAQAAEEKVLDVSVASQ